MPPLVQTPWRALERAVEALGEAPRRRGAPRRADPGEALPLRGRGGRARARQAGRRVRARGRRPPAGARRAERRGRRRGLASPLGGRATLVRRPSSPPASSRHSSAAPLTRRADLAARVEGARRGPAALARVSDARPRGRRPRPSPRRARARGAPRPSPRIRGLVASEGEARAGRAGAGGGVPRGGGGDRPALPVRPRASARRSTPIRAAGRSRSRYWAMVAPGQEPVAANEVDDVCWASPAEAAERLDYGHDREAARQPRRRRGEEAGGRLPRPARQGRQPREVAGARRAATADEARPATGRGTGAVCSAAERLAALVSSPYVRCVQTLEPLGDALDLPVQEHDALAEGGPYPPALELVGSVAALGPVALSTHGDVQEVSVQSLAARRRPARGPARLREGLDLGADRAPRRGRGRALRPAACLRAAPGRVYAPRDRRGGVAVPAHEIKLLSADRDRARVELSRARAQHGDPHPSSPTWGVLILGNPGRADPRRHRRPRPGDHGA